MRNRSARISLLLAVIALLATTACKKADQQGTTPEEQAKAQPEAVGKEEGAVASTEPPGLAMVPRKGAQDPKVVIIESSEFQ